MGSAVPVIRAYRPNGKPVEAGDEVTNFRGAKCRFVGISEMPEPGKAGRVEVTTSTGETRFYYPTVFDLKIHPEDRPAVFCTCCPDPKMVYLDENGAVRHVNGAPGDPACSGHIHVAYRSRDCDGDSAGTFTIQPFRMVFSAFLDDAYDESVNGALAVGGSVSTHRAEDDGPVQSWITHAPNDEGGGKTTEYRVCRRPECAYRAPTSRDLAAEAAGY